MKKSSLKCTWINEKQALKADNIFMTKIVAELTKVYFLFGLILYLPVNNSVMSGQVFLGWTIN